MLLMYNTIIINGKNDVQYDIVQCTWINRLFQNSDNSIGNWLNLYLVKK